MSVHSDDTDLLLLIPPDFFSIKSDSEDDYIHKPTAKLLVSDLITQVNDLEGRICMIENQTIMPTNLQNLRRFGSADTLTTPSKSSYNLRSLQTTPLKTNTLPSPCKGWRNSPSRYNHQNILESHQYVNQKEKDDKLLQEINDFFKQKNGDENLDDESKHLSTAVFNLNKVNDLLKQLEETQAEIEAKLKLKGLTDGDETDESSVNKQPSVIDKSPRRILDFDSMSPKKTEETPRDGGNGDSEKKRSETIDTEKAELTNLPSLRNLWGSPKKIDEGKPVEDSSKLKQRYEEEKCRRQHCEELIQKLQLRLLEEQQKIAVAIKVDKEKDEAIAKLTEGWNKLLTHWKDLESQKNVLSKRLTSEREKFQSEVAAACQTVKRYEAELSKALDLAHGYKEKCEMCEKEKINMSQIASKEIESLKSELKETKERLQREQTQNEKLEKLIGAKEESLNQTKTKLFETQTQIRELKKAIKDQQTEMEILKHEKDKLGEKLKDEKTRVTALEQSKKSLTQANEELKKKEKSYKETIKSLQEQMDKIKIDLKEFYQEQVERIVQEKLKEFQDQLTTAEKTLQMEIVERERKVTVMAVKQVQQIVEKHVVEVNLLEEKHKEEMELWKIKLVQAEEKVETMRKKLEHYSSQKNEIAQKLQSVMETQWQEALKIITASSPQNQKSPAHSDRSDKGVTRQDTFTMLSCGWGDGNLNKNAFPHESSPSETPFFKDGQLTFREEKKPETYRIDETPQKISADGGESLQKYIRMLLERPPGIPIDDTLDSTCINSDGSVLQWQHILSERSSHLNSDTTQHEPLKGFKGKENKMPWK